METAKWLFTVTSNANNNGYPRIVERCDDWKTALEVYKWWKSYAIKGETIVLERQLYVKNAYDEWEPANGLDINENYTIYQWTKK